MAFDHFKKFFELKTYAKWEDRLVKGVVPEEAFSFKPPKEGEPRGVLLEDLEEQVDAGTSV